VPLNELLRFTINAVLYGNTDEVDIFALLSHTTLSTTDKTPTFGQGPIFSTNDTTIPEVIGVWIVPTHVDPRHKAENMWIGSRSSFPTIVHRGMTSSKHHRIIQRFRPVG